MIFLVIKIMSSQVNLAICTIQWPCGDKDIKIRFTVVFCIHVCIAMAWINQFIIPFASQDSVSSRRLCVDFSYPSLRLEPHVSKHQMEISTIKHLIGLC